MAETPGQTAFYDVLADHYDRLFPVTDQQRRFLAGLVKEYGIRRVLDVACGSGGQSAFFRELGLAVSALENDEKMVKAVLRKDATINVVLGSMERVAELFAPGFDLVLCIGNSLPHLASLAAVRSTLEGMRALLNPGGVLLVSIVNFDRVIRDAISVLPVKEASDDQGRSVVLARAYDFSALPEHVTFSMNLRVGRTTYAASVPLLPLSPEWLIGQVAGLGMDIVGRFAAFDRTPFTPDAASLVLLARRV